MRTQHSRIRPATRDVSGRVWFRAGDYVYPTDLPRRLLCRVACAESGTTPTGAFQILTLEPLEKPWSEWSDATLIVRFDADVLPAPGAVPHGGS